MLCFRRQIIYGQTQAHTLQYASDYLGLHALDVKVIRYLILNA